MSTKVNQLQLLQQNLQNILLQKQQFESQQTELESALTEVQSSPSNPYKIVGKLMISSSKEKVVEDLQQQKEAVEIRLKNLNKQEETIKETISSLQSEVVKEMKK